MILVLLPKGNTDTWGIGLLESLWKVLETIIDTHLRASVQPHDVLNGFHTGKGMGMEILGLNLVKEIDRMDKEPLFLVSIVLCKAYEMVDRGGLLTALEGYSAGPRMCRLMVVFWYQQEVVN